MKIIAVINQKGGVGKTTITANLGHALALSGQRVLAVDLDPQGHLATALGQFRAPRQGADAVLLNEAPMAPLILHQRDGLHLLPAGQALVEAEQLREGGAERARLLKEALSRESLEYDIILLDCPPVFGILMANVLMVADQVLIPLNGDILSFNGLLKLLSTLDRMTPFRPQPLDTWVVLSRFQMRRRVSKEIVGKLQQQLPGQVLATPIRDAVALTECPSLGRTVFEYRPDSGAASDFIQLAEDLMLRRSLSGESH